MNSNSTNQKTNYENTWHNEPQDLGELRDLSLARNPFGTLRVLYRCPVFMLLAVLCFFGARDVAAGRFYFDLGNATSPVTNALFFIAAAFTVLAVMNWVTTYGHLNLFSQLFTLYGTVAVATYVRTHDAPFMDMLGGMVTATLGSFVFELGAIMWLIRRRDAERIHVLKRVSQLIGIAVAAVVFVWFVVLEGRR